MTFAPFVEESTEVNGEISVTWPTVETGEETNYSHVFPHKHNESDHLRVLDLTHSHTNTRARARAQARKRELYGLALVENTEHMLIRNFGSVNHRKHRNTS